MMCSGESFPQPPWVQDTSAKGSASLLPTPKAALSGPDYARQEKRTKSHGSGGDDLVTKIFRLLLPTPTTRDWKDTPGMSVSRPDGKTRLDQLPRVIFAASSPEKIGGMKLTPEFQCWLMGYPKNWLKPLRDALATPSSPKSSTPSSPPSAPSSEP